jgi:plasmid maintenance system antidote protein VapI
MSTRKEIKVKDVWNEQKQNDLKKFILSYSDKQSPERKIKNELLSIRFKIEDYIENDNSDQPTMIQDFVKMYLKSLRITQRRLAELFEMESGNLHKYLVGDRKLNSNLVLKLSSFTHTSPELWLRLQVKNELIEINREKENNKEYRKYDYENLLVAEP